MKFFPLLFLLAFFLKITAQQDQAFLNLRKDWNKVLNAESEEEKKQLNQIVQGRVGQYIYNGKQDLSQLDNFKDIYSSDSNLRIISWFFPVDASHFAIHGAYHFKDGNISEKISKSYLGQLESKDVRIRRDTVYSEDQWPAAWYYRAIKKEDRFGKTYYTLIGWIPKSRLSQQKIVDVLWFKDEKAQFGAPLFEREGKREYRLLYEYGAQNVMRLSYQVDKDQLIMDHLSPPGADYHGIYEYYGPDFSFDAFRWENDRWLYYPDVDVDEGLDKKKSEFKKDDKILEDKPIYKSE